MDQSVTLLAVERTSKVLFAAKAQIFSSPPCRNRLWPDKPFKNGHLRPYVWDKEAGIRRFNTAKTKFRLTLE
jgi:hypothetical protein